MSISWLTESEKRDPFTQEFFFSCSEKWNSQVNSWSQNHSFWARKTNNMFSHFWMLTSTTQKHVLHLEYLQRSAKLWENMQWTYSGRGKTHQRIKRKNETGINWGGTDHKSVEEIWKGQLTPKAFWKSSMEAYYPRSLLKYVHIHTYKIFLI